MPRFYNFQTTLNAGIIDPLLAARTDLKQYYNGMRIGKNIITLPQGGAKVRPGYKWNATVTNATTAYLDEAVLRPFSFNITQNYAMLFSRDRIYVFKAGVEVAQVTYPAAYVFGVGAMVKMSFAQSADTMIICHPDHEPLKLVRGASDTIWTLTLLAVKNIPAFNFDGTDVDQVQGIQFTGFSDLDTFNLTLGGEKTATITYSITPATTQSNIAAALHALTVTGSTGISVALDGSVYKVTFSDASAGPWSLMSSNVVSGTGTIAHTYVSGGEASWSATRGWPRAVTFHEGRLWFGGTTQRPQTIWGSVTSDFFNLELGGGFVDEGIEATLDTDQLNEIRTLFSSRQLQIFTSGGEFVTTDAPITPDNVSVRQQSRYGIGDIGVFDMEGSTVFLQRSGKALREFFFSLERDAYQSESASLLATALLRSPIDMAVSRGDETTDANYVYIINGDGKVSVLNTLASQGVTGWTEWESSVTVLSMTAVEDTLYLFCSYAGGYYLCEVTSDVRTDLSVVELNAPADAIISGLDHLDGVEIRVKADGSVLDNATPVAGSITIDRDASRIEAGLDFNPTIETMPITQSYQDGTILSRDKRLVKADIILNESLGIIINGFRIPDGQFGITEYGVAPTPITGIKEVYLVGWGTEATVTITQTDPLPFEILGLITQVEA